MATIFAYELKKNGKDYHFEIEFAGAIEAEAFFVLAKQMQGLLGVEVYRNEGKTKFFVELIALGKARKNAIECFLEMCMENPFEIG